MEIQRTIEFHLVNALLCCRFTCPQLVKIKTPSFKIKQCLQTQAYVRFPVTTLKGAMYTEQCVLLMGVNRVGT